MFDNVLVGVDGRQGGRDAIALARRLCAPEARIALAHVDGSDLMGAAAPPAELPWVPHAMAANPELEWQEVDGRTVAVSTQVAGQRPDGEARVGRESGDIVRCLAEARPRDVGGRLGANALGRRPQRLQDSPRHPDAHPGRGTGELPNTRFVYWRGQITAVRVEKQFDPV